MLVKELVFLLLLTGSTWESEASQCDLFHNGLLCSLDPISNIVGAVFDLESELECQAECVSNDNCNNFMFATFSNNRSNECFLLDECNTNTTSCKDTPNCNFSVTGPKTPSIPDACCEGFQGVTCEAESDIGHFYDVAEAPECQSLCRDTSNCSYWSLYGEICFLYSACNHPHPCSTLCTSGPVFPDISACKGRDIYDTLLIGGSTYAAGYSNSLELITQNRTCTPQMNQTVGKRGAAAAVLGSKIFYCGGSQDGIYVSTCHSFDLDTGGWQEEPSMVEARAYFGLSVIGDQLIAIGGFIGTSPASSSAEIFMEEKGWRIEPRFNMSAPRDLHCTVVLGSWLFTVGGLVCEASFDNASNMVEAIDTTVDSSTWITKGSMLKERAAHACHVGNFEGQEGIYVAGSENTDQSEMASAEFYNSALDTWQEINSLLNARAYAQMTMLGTDLIMTGYTSTVETWTGSIWVELDNNRLEVGRYSHAAVSIKTGILTFELDHDE